jgi:drug/metabolite transporter (DMT)-like permease
MVAFVYILLCLLWGSTWIAIKIGLSQAPPLLTASFRFLLAMSILLGICYTRGYRFPREIRQWLSLGYPGIYMYCVSYALIYFAELYITSALTAVLFASFPFFVAIFSSFRLKNEQITPLAWVGLAIGFAGVVLISYDRLSVSDDLFLGTLLALGGSCAAAYGIVIHKKRFARENIYVSVTVQMITGGVLLVLAALLFEDISDFVVSPETIGSIIYLALFGTVVTFLGYYWLLSSQTVVTVSLIAFITPLVAIIIGAGFFDEQLSLHIAVGTALILAGVALVARRKGAPATRPDISTKELSA